MADGSRLRRWIVAGAVVALATTACAPTVHADPAGPTDYRSEVIAIDPATPTIEARIIGGDSFFELEVEPGTEVFVLGYQDERYLWFRADGVVFENRRAPSTYLNDDRFGGGDIPADATAEAEPDWEQVASGGSWVWHDHRAHWMQESRPVGFQPGDEILAASIPVVVDGGEVEVRVVSVWQPAPASWPVWLGALAGIATVAAAWALRRRGGAAIIALLPVAVLTFVVGAWQYWSLPAATGPRLVWIVLPAIAVACAAVGVVVARGRSGFASDASMLVVGVELAVWGFAKRDGLSAAIIPTDAPMWLDRFVTALALAGGVAAAGCGLWWLFGATGGRPVSDPTERSGSPRPVHP